MPRKSRAELEHAADHLLRTGQLLPGSIPDSLTTRSQRQRFQNLLGSYPHLAAGPYFSAVTSLVLAEDRLDRLRMVHKPSASHAGRLDEAERTIAALAKFLCVSA